MKRPRFHFLVFMLFGISVVGCGDCGGPSTPGSDRGGPGKTLSSQEPEESADEVFGRFVDAFNEKNAPLLAEYVGLDSQWVNRFGQKRSFVGHTAVMECLYGQLSILPDVRMGIRRMIVKGKLLVAQVVVKGTQQGVLEGHAATGKPVSYEAAYLVRVEDGQIKLVVATLNMMVPLRQMGLYPGQRAPLPTFDDSRLVVDSPAIPGSEDLVKQFYRLLEAGKLEDLDRVMSPDVLFRDHSTGDVLGGTDAVRDRLTKSFKGRRGVKGTVEGFLSADDFTVTSFVWVDPPTGGEGVMSRPVAVHGVHVFRIDGDRIVEMESYIDELQRMPAAGETGTVEGGGPAPLLSGDAGMGADGGALGR